MVLRLLQPLSSSTAKEGMPIEAVLISPRSVDGKLIPSGATLKGKVTKAQPVGMALVHETAALIVEFNELHLPNGETRALHCRLIRVENSRERWMAQGRSMESDPPERSVTRATSKLSSVRAIDPVAYLFTSVTSTAVLGFSEPEILYRRRAPSCW